MRYPTAVVSFIIAFLFAIYVAFFSGFGLGGVIIGAFLIYPLSRYVFEKLLSRKNKK